MPVPLHSTPVSAGPPAPLPAGVTRCPQAGPQTTLENCCAVQVYLRPLDGGAPFSVIAWRDRPARVRPIGRPRITALRPGDWARWNGGVFVVDGIEVWR
ncbi:hypothetical protein Pla123a_43190 [Posidoniimonas polymericola]|uniref:Uncharacterized protein n=1 Tax=Posidoniimonas polymericola TaxID=2528002 RepID=A0A5C5XXU3_9BACT|nr:hypothetical protein [Posidoniimonas polymericola]TWT67760.1 hypothetical protein Pla123a_43190 [Posidoniimonas polymericola]